MAQRRFLRRYILLILIVLQNHHCDQLYEDHSALSGLGINRSFRDLATKTAGFGNAIAAYLLQTGILILFAVLFCWVSAKFWTALMGFLQLLIGKDKYSISSTIKGDEALNPAHRTALIMPICNEDVERVFAGYVLLMSRSLPRVSSNTSIFMC